MSDTKPKYKVSFKIEVSKLEGYSWRTVVNQDVTLDVADDQDPKSLLREELSKHYKLATDRPMPFGETSADSII